ncbi:MAG: polyamine aminopropyltransferase [Candidatus Nealsonbacteria bacterium]|nr:polyamine aminopropyltransferase [Candidatus Nealsonbacteria bacterium]
MKRKFLFGKNWFIEDFIPGETPTLTWGVVSEKEIYSGRSLYQKINIFDTKEFGRIMTLDGLTQLSTKQEFIYHEMLVHPAFFYHKNPKRVLIIGGGDGGVLREVVKHPVKEVILVDIDQKVIEVSKKYLPTVSAGAFGDKRVKVLCQDALEFVKRYRDYFDIIINDLTDPTGVSLFLWTTKFYQDIKRALKKDGVAIFQTAYLNEKFAKKSRKKIKKVFPFFGMHKAYVKCFPFDEHTFSVGSRGVDFRKSALAELKRKYKKLKIKTKYYDPTIHFASQVMPKYFKAS